MANCYNLDGIKTSLKIEIEEKEAILKAWENVTFPTKKNGEPFAVMSKNINGATYKKADYGLSANNVELKVVANNNHKWTTDSIDCYTLVRYLKDKSKIAKTENYMPKELCLEQVYKFDLEDIKEAVNNRIEYLKGYVESLKKQLEIADKAYAGFRKVYEDAMAVLDNVTETKKDEYSFLKSSILDTIKNRYPYC